MRKSYWLASVAAASIACASQAQPVNSVIAGNGGVVQSSVKQNANLAPSPQTIESDVERIARALEVANNKQPSAEELQRAQQNLDDQNRMAFWASAMFWVGMLEAIITGAGVWLVYRTLVHTKRAADAAQAAVAEAKEATKAANSSVIVAREIGQAQIRAYLSCEDSGFEIANDAFNCWPKFKNTGQSPARKIEFSADVTVWDREMTKRCEAVLERGAVPPMGAGATANGLLSVLKRNFKGDPISFLDEGVHVSIRGIVTWTDVFGIEDAMAFSLTQIDASEITGPASYQYRHGHMGARNRTPITQEEWEQEEAFLASVEENDS